MRNDGSQTNNQRPDGMSSTNRNQRFWSNLGLTLFFCAAAFLLAFFVWFVLIRRSAAPRIAKLQSTRDELQSVVDRLNDGERQLGVDKQVVIDLLHHCRSVEDIPDFQGGQVIARHNGPGRLRIYVPAGSHTLEIACTWKPSKTRKQTQNGIETEEAKVACLVGEKTKSMPLLPSAGYWFEVETERKGGPIRWEVTSNRPDFETQSAVVPFDGFSHTGATWSGSGVVQPPTRVSRLGRGGGPFTAPAKKGVQLMDSALLGSREDVHHEVRFDLRLISDGPPTVSAREAQRLISLKRGGLLESYNGDGNYKIRLPSAPQTDTD